MDKTYKELQALEDLMNLFPPDYEALEAIAKEAVDNESIN